MAQKIIQILCHTLENNDALKYHVFTTFGARQLKDIGEVTHSFEREAWYAVKDLSKEIKIKKDGIIFRLFPAQTLTKGLESFFGIISCPSLFRALRKEDPSQILIHFQGERGTILHWLLFKYPQYRVVLQYHGYGQPWWLQWLEYLCITPLEFLNFPKIKHFFVPIKPRVSYLNKIGISQECISYENIAIDYTKFKLMSKDAARRSLEIPKKAFVMLYIGPLVSSKGVDTMMDTYIYLKQTYPDLYLLFVGSRKTDPLYQKAKTVADKLEELISNDSLVTYYNAADVYCFYGNKKTRTYAGPGIAVTEALVCNVNVVSTNLIHFPDNIVKQIGLIPSSKQEFVSQIKYLLQHPEIQFRARDIIEPFVSKARVAKSILKVYEKILN